MTGRVLRLRGVILSVLERWHRGEMMNQVKLYNLFFNMNGRRLVLNSRPETYEHCLKLKSKMSAPDDQDLKIEEFIVDPVKVPVLDIFVFEKTGPVSIGKVYQSVGGGYLVRLRHDEKVVWYEALVEINNALKGGSYDWDPYLHGYCSFKFVKPKAWEI